MSRVRDLFADRRRRAGGAVGAVLVDADGREHVAVDPDGVYPAASVIKLPLVMALFEDEAEGRLSLDESVTIRDRVGGSGVLQELAGVSALTLRDLATLAMEISDNTATNQLIDRVGIGRVNERLRAWGCVETVMKRKLFDNEAKARGLENLMTPRETARLLRRVLEGAAAGHRAGTEVLRLLEHNQNTQRLGSFLPRGAALAHKDGWGSDPDFVENDAGIVRAATPVIAVGFTHLVHPALARPLLGYLGLAAAETAGADLSGLPPDVLRGA